MKTKITFKNVTISIELKEATDLIDYETMESTSGKVLSISGMIRRGINSSCGQNRKKIFRESIKPGKLPYRKKIAVLDILEIWKKYHMNDFMAGNKQQTDFIREKKLSGTEYTELCRILKENNLYEVNGYTYGSKWLYKPIPQEVLDRLYTDIKILSSK